MALVRNAGHLVDKAELFQAVWPDTIVEEGNLAHNVSILRNALGEGKTDQQYIETIPKRGYRFVAGVIVEDGPERGSLRKPAEPSAATAARCSAALRRTARVRQPVEVSKSLPAHCPPQP